MEWIFFEIPLKIQNIKMIVKLISSSIKNIVKRQSKRTLSTAEKFEFNEATFETHNCPRPPSFTEATREEMLDLYKKMVEIRRLEMACDQAYKAKLIRGFCHLSIGQEAIAAGMEAAIQKNDSIITAYRCHGFTLTRGGSAFSIISELMGKKTGSSRGKGGSMHLFGNEFYGGNGIVGAQVIIAL